MSSIFDKHANALVALCSEGLTTLDACAQRGLRYKTCEAWLSKGRREPDGRYGAFTKAVDEARAKPVDDNKQPGEVYQATRLTLLGLKLGQEHELGKAQALALAETIDELRHTKGGAAATGMPSSPSAWRRSWPSCRCRARRTAWITSSPNAGPAWPAKTRPRSIAPTPR
jgi:hypothetical protein